MITKISCPVKAICFHDPDAIAYISNTKLITYREFHQQILETQAYCRGKNIRLGTKVAIQSQNCPEYMILLFALWRIGAVACLLSPQLPPKEVDEQLKRLNCKICLKTLTSSLPFGKQHTQSDKALKVFHPEVNNLKKQSLSYKNAFLLNNTATIILTSGSSGHPKAVVHTIKNHYFNALGSNKNIPVKRSDRWLLSLPLYHVSGLSIIWRCVLSGSTIVFIDKTDDLTGTIKESKISHISLVPIQLRRILMQSAGISVLKKLKAILLGGSSVHAELLHAVQKFKLPVFLTYGLTEMASQVATSFKPSGKKMKLLPYRQLKITRLSEILVRGKTLFKGYLKNGRIVQPIDKAGWFHTGDIGKLTRKEGLQILGRMDNMFVSGGENIYPEEIEKALLASGLVDEAIIVPVKNIEFGFRPVAFIKCFHKKKNNIKKLKCQLAKTLPSFKIPDLFYDFPAQYLQKGIKPNRQALKSYLNLL